MQDPSPLRVYHTSQPLCPDHQAITAPSHLVSPFHSANLHLNAIYSATPPRTSSCSILLKSILDFSFMAHITITINNSLLNISLLSQIISTMKAKSISLMTAVFLKDQPLQGYVVLKGKFFWVSSKIHNVNKNPEIIKMMTKAFLLSF